MDSETGQRDPARPIRRRRPSPVERPVMSATVVLAGRRPRLPAGVSCGVRAGSRHRRLRRDREGLPPAGLRGATASTSSGSTISSPRRRAVPETRSPSSGHVFASLDELLAHPRDRHRRHRDRSRGPPRAHRASRRGRETRARAEAARARRRSRARSRRGGRAPRRQARREPERALVAAVAHRDVARGAGAIGDVIASDAPARQAAAAARRHALRGDRALHDLRPLRPLDRHLPLLARRSARGGRSRARVPAAEPACGSGDAGRGLGRDPVRGRRERDDPRHRRRADEAAVVPVLGSRNRGHDPRQRPRRIGVRRARARRRHDALRPRGHVESRRVRRHACRARPGDRRGPRAVQLGAAQPPLAGDHARRVPLGRRGIAARRARQCKGGARCRSAS